MSACSWLYCQEKTPKESVLTPTSSLFSAETWISNRASLLASQCLVFMALYLSLSLSLAYTPVWGLDYGSWLCVFCLKLWGIGNKFVHLNVCCVVLVLTTLVLDYIWSVCVCETYVCVLLSSRILAVTQQSRGEAARLVSAAVSSEKIWRRGFLPSMTKLVII